MWFLHESAVLKACRNAFFGSFDTQSADVDRADQRVSDRAAFGHTAIEGEVGILKDDDPNRIALPKFVVNVGAWFSCCGQRSRAQRNDAQQ